MTGDSERRAISPLVIAFDLDMTLIDSRPSVAAALHALARETGRTIDVESIAEHLGPPIATLLLGSFDASEMDGVVNRFLELYLKFGVPLTLMMPGADAAVDAVRDAGGRVVVITAKHERTARPSLECVGLTVDTVIGSHHGEQKRIALGELGAALYVGDTPPDVAAALAARAYPVGVVSGPSDTAALRAAGAADVLESLMDFPDFFDSWLEQRAFLA
jgi:phosphoglycolate phosphatase